MEGKGRLCPARPNPTFADGKAGILSRQPQPPGPTHLVKPYRVLHVGEPVQPERPQVHVLPQSIHQALPYRVGDNSCTHTRHVMSHHGLRLGLESRQVLRAGKPNTADGFRRFQTVSGVGGDFRRGVMPVDIDRMLHPCRPREGRPCTPKGTAHRAQKQARSIVSPPSHTTTKPQALVLMAVDEWEPISF